MAQLFDQNVSNGQEIPALRRERSVVREALEALQPGQTIKYDADEQPHVHREAAPSQRNNYACYMQDLVGRLNRAPGQSTRLQSMHDTDGAIYIYCVHRKRIYDN